MTKRVVFSVNSKANRGWWKPGESSKRMKITSESGIERLIVSRLPRYSGVIGAADDGLHEIGG